MHSDGTLPAEFPLSDSGVQSFIFETPVATVSIDNVAGRIDFPRIAKSTSFRALIATPLVGLRRPDAVITNINVKQAIVIEVCKKAAGREAVIVRQFCRLKSLKRAIPMIVVQVIFTVAAQIKITKAIVVKVANSQSSPKAVKSKACLFCGVVKLPFAPLISEHAGEIVACRWYGNWAGSRKQ